MENASALLIVTAQPLFYQTLRDHLGIACRQASVDAVIEEASTLGLLLLPETSAAIAQMNALIERSSLPALMLLPEGTHRTEPRCASLQRPITLPQLKTEINQLLRQPRKLQWECGFFDPITLILSDHKGKQTPLTEKEAGLLTYLSVNRKSVSREALLEDVWRYHPETETHTLETHLYRLRQKLKDVFGENLQITSDENGYCLITE